MQDTELYRQLLGLHTPWTVTRVELKVKEQRVEVWAGHAASARWPCPEGATDLGLYDHAEERTWRHLDSCQFQTYLHARPPRVQCPTHGVRQVRLPWVEPPLGGGTPRAKGGQEAALVCPRRSGATLDPRLRC